MEIAGGFPVHNKCGTIINIDLFLVSGTLTVN